MRPNLTHELLVSPGDVRFAQTPTKGKLVLVSNQYLRQFGFKPWNCRNWLGSQHQ